MKKVEFSAISVHELANGLLPVNSKVAGIVPMANKKELDALEDSIRNNGQIEPVILWRGEIIDGRCRQDVISRLGRPFIMYKSIPDEYTQSEAREIALITNVRRSLTNTQKACCASKQFYDSSAVGNVDDVCKVWGIGRTTVIASNYIYRERPDMFEALFNGEQVEIEDVHGKKVFSHKITAVKDYLRRKQKEQCKSREVPEYLTLNSIDSEEGRKAYAAIIARLEASNYDSAVITAVVADLCNKLHKD